ncbi:MAG TPA: exodeoxyribonuclease VII small subunit [Acidiferrobacteraceae bacterium]|nr:exodeoxyribonuclease VII small subunit [Acidiferrobacteraceae bacterium]
MAEEKPKLPDFESALSELESIVTRLESGEQSLEDALTAFQRGMELTRVCQQGLRDAEQRVEQLIQEQDGSVRIAPFTPDQDR